MLVVLLATVALASAGNLKAQLQDPAWHDAVAKEGMDIGSGRTKRLVQRYSRQATNSDEPCELPNGDPGVCRPVYICMQEEFKSNFIKFADYLCVLDSSNTRKIGACCPVKSDELGLAGELPATASKDEDVLKINIADNRGNNWEPLRHRCGLSTRPHARVTGSRPADTREWPWMASITPTGFEQYCGGVLITDRHVLTAAHCVRRWQADELEVRLGEYDFKRNNDSRSYNFRVVEKRQHEDFQLSSYKNDIAILKLNRPAVFNTYVWPICLPPLGLDIVNETTVIIGWGTQWYGGPHSHVLMEVSVPIWDIQQCRSSFNDAIFDENICAGDYSGGKDACQGDSGGPLMYQMSSGRWATIGVVSWGLRCGEPNHPGVYTRVDAYLPWILENARF